MLASNNIHPPKNWQDFEMLCLKLWGELWEIPHEIEFNSDNSQGQDGVDIYGPIENGKNYYGIQCKNRKLNLIDGEKNRLSIADIDSEIEKACKFQPPLSKLIIATSLYKDQKIEQHVRLKSLANVSNGLFPIQICFWEFFERKIVEFPKVYDWYIKNEHFHAKTSVSITFDDGEVIAKYQPRYQRNITISRLPEEKPELTNLLDVSKVNYLNTVFKTFSPIHPFVFSGLNNHDWVQYFWFKLSIHNTGQTTLEEIKIELDFEGEFEKVGPSEGNPLYGAHITNVHSYSNTDKSLWIGPQRVLVQSDGFNTGLVYLKPIMAKAASINVRWRLLARDFTAGGDLKIVITPQYYVKTTYLEVTDPLEVGKEESITFIQRKGQFNPISGLTYSDNPEDFPVEE